MKLFIRAAFALLALSACTPVGAQVVTLPQVKNAGGQFVPSMGVVCIDLSGAYVGCSGSGGGGANVVWADQDAQTLASSATYSGTSRDRGVAAGVAGSQTYFNAFFVSSQTGTAYIQGSSDGTTWVNVTSAANGVLTATTPLILTVPVLFRYYRAQIVNGSTSATITVHSSFTGA